MQYVGDTRIQTLLHYYLSRDRRLARNAVKQFSWSIMPNGLTQSRYPSRVQQIIPPFSLFWVLMVSDQMVYDRINGDAHYWWDQSTRARKVCEAFQDIWDGIEPQHWCFMDWVDDWAMGVPPGGSTDSSIIELHSFAEIAEIFLRHRSLNMRLEGFDWAALRQELEPSRATSVEYNFGSKPSEHFDALSNLRQRFAGGEPKAYHSPKEAAKCTYYFQYYKHLAMQPDDYLAELEPWKEMIRNGLTTFAEAPEPTRSDCHAWSAHPVLGFFQLIAGVTSTAPEWKKARIAPKPGKLKDFDARIAHPDGDLTIRWKGGHIEVDSPVPYEFVWKGKKIEAKEGRTKY